MRNVWELWEARLAAIFISTKIANGFADRSYGWFRSPRDAPPTFIPQFLLAS